MVDALCDILAAQRGEGGLPLKVAMERLVDEESAVVVLLHQPENPEQLVRRIRDYQLQDQGVNLPKPEALADMRSYGVGAQILVDLGVGKMRNGVTAEVRNVNG